jgi:hypothetical protein
MSLEVLFTQTCGSIGANGSNGICLDTGAGTADTMPNIVLATIAIEAPESLRSAILSKVERPTNL